MKRGSRAQALHREAQICSVTSIYTVSLRASISVVQTKPVGVDQEMSCLPRTKKWNKLLETTGATAHFLGIVRLCCWYQALLVTQDLHISGLTCR